jgi:hypothetical protein
LSLCKPRNWFWCGLLLVVGSFVTTAFAADAVIPQWKVDVEFSPQVRKDPFTGRVYLFFSEHTETPRLGPSWFRPEPFLSREVVDWKPSETITFS